MDAAIGGGASAEAFFERYPVGLAVYRVIDAAVRAIGPVTVRTSKSQIAFANRRGFAYLWIPGRWLRNPGAEVVLSIALARHDPSARFKQVVHPASRIWMHHLELNDASEIDAEVVGWLREAYAAAS